MSETCLMTVLQGLMKLQATEGATTHDLSKLGEKIQQISNDGREWKETFPTENRIQIIRSTIEALSENKTVIKMENVQELYGQLSFKCPKPWCYYFLDGFKTLQKRDDHVSKHERPFRCDSDGCFGRIVGFLVEAELSKHNSRLHNKGAAVNFPSMGARLALRKSRFKILKAAADGNLARVQECVETGADINSEEKGSFPLLTAATNGRFEVCEYLLAQGADVNKQSGKRSTTALHAAVMRNDADVVQLLISHGALTSIRDTSGETPVFLADGTGSKQTLAAFPDESLTHKSCRGADCLVASTSGTTSLWDSISDKETIDSEVLDMVRRGCFDLNSPYGNHSGWGRAQTGSLPLNLALFKNRSIIANALIETGRVDFHKFDGGLLPLHFACRYSTSKDIIERVLFETRFPDTLTMDSHQHAIEIVCRNENLRSPGMQIERRSIISTIPESGRCNINEPNAQGRLLLHHICKNGSTEAVELVLHRTTAADTRDRDGMSPLDLAVKHDHVDVIDILLASGRFNADQPTGNGDLPLHLACARGLTKSVKSLLSRTQIIDARGVNGMTPLGFAILGKHLDVIDILLESDRYNLNKPDQNGDLPLHVACEYGIVEAVKLILPRTQMIKTRDGGGMTVMELAIMQSSMWNLPVLDVLLDSGRFDIDKPDSEGRLPLHLACKMGRRGAVILLLRWTRDIHAKDSHDMTPLEIAVLEGHVTIVDTFLEFNPESTDTENPGIQLTPVKRDFNMLDTVFSSPCSVNMGLTALHWGAWSKDMEILGDQLLKCATEDIHTAPKSIPTGWDETLGFRSKSIRVEWRSIFLTPLMLTLNVKFDKRRYWGEEQNSNITDSIWEDMVPTLRGVDLSGLFQSPFSDGRLLVVITLVTSVNATANETLYKHMAAAGLSLPWGRVVWEGGKISMRTAGLEFDVEDGRPISLSRELLLAIVCSSHCRFTDVMTGNFDLAVKIMRDVLQNGAPGELNLVGVEADIELLTFIHQQAHGLYALSCFIQLGLDGYAALRHAAMAGKVDLIAPWVYTKMLDPMAEPRDEHCETACDIAVRNGHVEVAKLLVDAGFRFNTRGSPLVLPYGASGFVDLEEGGGSEFDYLGILDEYTSPGNEI